MLITKPQLPTAASRINALVGLLFPAILAQGCAVSKPVPTANPETQAEATPAAQPKNKHDSGTEADKALFPPPGGNFNRNQVPEYPAIARLNGWEGKTVLKVLVTAEGLCESISIQSSSGYELLDQSALNTVKKWRFIPAKKADRPVSSEILVPVVFAIK